MPQMTIGRMAKLYGLHRSTLYEAVDKGRVTAAFNGKGQKVIDLSEMIRVYGEPPGQESTLLQNPTPKPDALPYTPNVLEKFDALLEVVKEQRDELRQLREEVAQLRRLPAPTEADDWSSLSDLPAADAEFLQERHVGTSDEDRPQPTNDHDPHGLRALARSLYQDES